MKVSKLFELILTTAKVILITCRSGMQTLNTYQVAAHSIFVLIKCYLQCTRVQWDWLLSQRNLTKRHHAYFRYRPYKSFNNKCAIVSAVCTFLCLPNFSGHRCFDFYFKVKVRDCSNVYLLFSSKICGVISIQFLGFRILSNIDKKVDENLAIGLNDV